MLDKALRPTPWVLDPTELSHDTSKLTPLPRQVTRPFCCRKAERSGAVMEAAALVVMAMLVVLFLLIAVVLRS